MSSTTKKFLELRNDPCCCEIITGEWFSSFSTMKKYALDNKLPFIAIWSNGDLCSHCVNLEKVLLTKTVQDGLKNSGYVMWFGCNLDSSKDDKYRGTGFKWCYNNGAVSLYPFVRLYWKNGSKVVNKIITGDTLRGRKTGKEGAKNVLNYLKKTFKDYTPQKKTLKVRLNPDWTQEQIDEFRKEIKENGGHCPCQIPSPDTICMCKNFRNKKDEGLCICELYEKYFS